MPKAAVFWSGGKDSFMALCEAVNHFNVEFLITTFDENSRSHAHEFEELLFLAQSKSIGIELVKVVVEGSEYNEALQNTVLDLKARGVDNFIFGDIFLEDIRKYREKIFEGLSVNVHFPLWGMSELELKELFWRNEVKAVVSVVNTGKLAVDFLGKELGSSFFKMLPAGTNHFGENGEFHTFCFDGKLFSEPVTFEAGGVITKSHSFFTSSGDLHETKVAYLDVSVKT